MATRKTSNESRANVTPREHYSDLQKNEAGGYSVDGLMHSAGVREFISPHDLCAAGPFFISSMEIREGGKFGDQVVYDAEWKDPESGEQVAVLAFSLSAKSEARMKVYHAFQALKQKDPDAVVGPLVLTTLKGSGKKNPAFVFRSAKLEDYAKGTNFEGAAEAAGTAEAAVPARSSRKAAAKKTPARKR